MSHLLSDLINRYPELSVCKETIKETYSILKNTFFNGSTLYVCGNGGSASDAEHIVGELMKEFKLPRPISSDIKDKLESIYGESGKFIGDNLQEGLRAISLTSHPSLSTAFSNDVNASLVFAQQLFSLGKKGDTLLGISTSGNSDNVLKSIQLASVMGIKTIILTGSDGGKIADIADCTIKVPEEETFKIQELHLPIYHTLCLMLEEHFYG